MTRDDFDNLVRLICEIVSHVRIESNDLSDYIDTPSAYDFLGSQRLDWIRNQMVDEP